MEIIHRAIEAIAKRLDKNRVIHRVASGFWIQIENKSIDIALIGDRRSVKSLIKYADAEQRNRVLRIIYTPQIEKIVPELQTNHVQNGIDLVVVLKRDSKTSISDTVRKHLTKSIPVFTMFEDQLISYRMLTQNSPVENKAHPEKTYIVASSRRTGSTMFCNFLQQTGVLGYPNEYISQRLTMLTELDMIDPGYVLSEALSFNQTPNGVFGIKINWSAMEQFNKVVLPRLGGQELQRFQNLLNRSSYIFLTRRNKIRQAISDWRAISTGVFHVRKKSKGRIRKQHKKRLPYDYRKLKRCLSHFVKSEDGWRDYFKTNNIEPVGVVYEDFVEQPKDTVHRILNYLGENCPSLDIVPDTTRLSDEYTEEIYGMFVRDLENEFGKDIVRRFEGNEPEKDYSLNREQRRENVFVTLATGDFLDMAKQLFASAYFNAGWDGDFLLLAHDIPDEELSWFRERGIIIKHTLPLFEGQIGGMHPCLADKVHMFTPYFRRWRTVIYSDLDAIVKESLDELKQVEGLWVVEDWSPTLTEQIVSEKDTVERGLDPAECREIIGRVEKQYDVSRRPFCAGFLAFSTDIITDTLYDELIQTIGEYQMITKYGDQLAMNLFFYNSWKKLRPSFNVLVAQQKTGDSYRTGAHTRWGLAEDINPYVLHIFNPKPWNKESDYYWEWLLNLKRADQTGLCVVDKDFEAGIEKIKKTEKHIRLRENVYKFIDRFVPFKGTALYTLNFVYWRYITFRWIASTIAVNAHPAFIKRLLGKEH